MPSRNAAGRRVLGGLGPLVPAAGVELLPRRRGEVATVVVSSRERTISDTEHLIDRGGLEVLRTTECLELLRAAPVARIAFVEAGEPMVLPVNHVVDRDGIAFRTAPGSMLGAAMMARPVAVEVDGIDEDERTGWSVLVRGMADVVLDGATLDRLDALGLEPWADAIERLDWVRVRPTAISGRRVLRD